jgi:hypothetical protein
MTGTDDNGMKRVWLLIIAGLLACLTVQVAGAAPSSVTISAAPGTAHVGDIITFNGSVSGVPTIAVYLFVTGPDLDPRGVTLDNLNIVAGQGLFTTAPVRLDERCWTYRWDTSVILGSLKSGTYTVYVVRSPHDRLRFTENEYASVDIRFLPSDKPSTQAPLEPVLVLGAIGIAGCCIMVSRIGKKKY